MSKIENVKVLGTPELSFEFSESGMTLQEVIDAVKIAYPEWKFNRSEKRYDSCLVAIFVPTYY